MSQQRPKTREEMLTELLIGETKDTLDRMDQTIAVVKDLHKAITDIAVAAQSSVQQGQTDLVAAHRELQKQLADIERHEVEMIQNLYKKTASSLNRGMSARLGAIAAVAALAAFLGGFGGMYVMARLIGLIH